MRLATSPEIRRKTRCPDNPAMRRVTTRRPPARERNRRGDESREKKPGLGRAFLLLGVRCTNEKPGRFETAGLPRRSAGARGRAFRAAYPVDGEMQVCAKVDYKNFSGAALRGELNQQRQRHSGEGNSTHEQEQPNVF
jgi:hypothetical protein